MLVDPGRPVRIGTTLFSRATHAGLHLTNKELASTFLLDIDSSTLAHRRNGFRLLSGPGSQWALEQRVAAKTADYRVESK